MPSALVLRETTRDRPGCGRGHVDYAEVPRRNRARSRWTIGRQAGLRRDTDFMWPARRPFRRECRLRHNISSVLFIFSSSRPALCAGRSRAIIFENRVYVTRESNSAAWGVAAGRGVPGRGHLEHTHHERAQVEMRGRGCHRVQRLARRGER